MKKTCGAALLILDDFLLHTISISNRGRAFVIHKGSGLEPI